ncbi:hypothetical protein CR513_36489, partial [Mucuna pruriens]
MKNETLSINKYVVLSNFLWMIMFIITLQVRYMPELCGRRLNLYISRNSLHCQITLMNFKISGMDIKFEDEILRLLLLNSLPESWDTFKVSITNSTPNGVVSLQMVKDSILHEEMRKKEQDSSSQSEVLVTENKGRSQKKEREKSRSKSKFRYKNVESIVSREKKRTKAKRVMIFVILRDFESVNLVFDESSGATLHVTPRKEFFTSYTLGDFGVLKMGNDGVTKVIGVGDVCLQTNIGMHLCGLEESNML